MNAGGFLFSHLSGARVLAKGDASALGQTRAIILRVVFTRSALPILVNAGSGSALTFATACSLAVA
jgi:thiazole synthase ThiGH ThiG subunit